MFWLRKKNAHGPMARNPPVAPPVSPSETQLVCCRRSSRSTWQWFNGSPRKMGHFSLRQRLDLVISAEELKLGMKKRWRFGFGSTWMTFDIKKVWWITTIDRCRRTYMVCFQRTSKGWGMPSILVNAREQAPIMGEGQLLPCGNKNSKKTSTNCLGHSLNRM